MLVIRLCTQTGESRALNIPRMGDVVLINTGDGVFTGREPHTSHESNETLQCSRCMDASSITISLNLRDGSPLGYRGAKDHTAHSAQTGSSADPMWRSGGEALRGCEMWRARGRLVICRYCIVQPTVCPKSMLSQCLCILM